jgi:tripartite-type tricarboxylate transporter receptor subunit TctC
MRLSASLLLSLLLWTAAAAPAFSQDYPTRPLRLVTGAAGGGNDFVTRVIAQGLAARFGKPAVVDNRASGVLEGEVVARATPDGYTLLVSSANLWISGLMQKVPYDPIKDFRQITLATNSPYILIVYPQLPAKSVEELIALAKAQPNKLNCVTLAVGSSAHLAAEMFRVLTGVEMTRVPYKGAPAGISDIITGQTHLMFAALGTALPHVKSGRLRALAVTSAQPSPLVPGLPTVAATVKGYETGATLGVLAPAKTPAPIIARLNQVIVEHLKSAEARERLAGVAVETVGSTPEEFTAFMKQDRARWEKIIRAAGIRVEP